MTTLEFGAACGEDVFQAAGYCVYGEVSDYFAFDGDCGFFVLEVEVEVEFQNGEAYATFASQPVLGEEYSVETVFRGKRGTSDDLKIPVIVVDDGDIDRDGFKDYLDGFGWAGISETQHSAAVVFSPRTIDNS